MDLATHLVSKHLEGAAGNSVERLRSDIGGIGLRRVHPRRHVRVHQADVQGRHVDTAVRELDS